MDLEKLILYDLKNENREFINKKTKRARFRLLKFFGKRYNIIIHINGSSVRIDIFKKFIKRLILINNRIKWNS
jgi:hypothetical protein